MRPIFLLPALALAAVSFGQVKLKVMANSARIGTLTVSQKPLADGGKSVEFLYALSNSGVDVTVRQTTVWDKDGKQIRSSRETTSKSSHSTRVVTYSGQIANLVIIGEGARKAKSITLAQSQNRADASQFWFQGVTPEVGAKVEYWSFNIADAEWQLATTTYEGPTEFKVGTSKVAGHKIKTVVGDVVADTILDDKGNLLYLKSNGLTLERLPG